MNPRELSDKQVVMRHYRLMDHRAARPEAGLVSPQVSRSCGDRLTLYIDFDGDGHCARATYQGEGCSVSVASASMLCAAVRGLTVEAMGALSADVITMLEASDEAVAREAYDRIVGRGGAPDDASHVADPHIDDILALWSIRSVGARIPCALLSWKIIPALAVEDTLA